MPKNGCVKNKAKQNRIYLLSSLRSSISWVVWSQMSSHSSANYNSKIGFDWFSICYKLSSWLSHSNLLVMCSHGFPQSLRVFYEDITTKRDPSVMTLCNLRISSEGSCSTVAMLEPLQIFLNLLHLTSSFAWEIFMQLQIHSHIKQAYKPNIYW